jgi:hypothetical protein
MTLWTLHYPKPALALLIAAIGISGCNGCGTLTRRTKVIDPFTHGAITRSDPRIIGSEQFHVGTISDNTREPSLVAAHGETPPRLAAG